ncbi:5626_t:CDS:2 [Acaulospora morrowiae]|uniref:5626_t:CDS:1 n=1 Tax=Acaulospora morrowiae TaxID=94023 RepID=A0A9N8ZD19_9GLOM|nr:5626_t:CDS:2 [Acaulospora morrowiae]
MGLTIVINNKYQIIVGIVAVTKIVMGIGDKNQTITETTIDTTNPNNEGDFYITEAVTNIQKKFACRLWRYMDAYNRGLEGKVSEWAVSKFKSHRQLPENIERIIEIEYGKVKMGGNEQSNK